MPEYSGIVPDCTDAMPEYSGIVPECTGGWAALPDRSGIVPRCTGCCNRSPIRYCDCYPFVLCVQTEYMASLAIETAEKDERQALIADDQYVAHYAQLQRVAVRAGVLPAPAPLALAPALPVAHGYAVLEVAAAVEVGVAGVIMQAAPVPGEALHRKDDAVHVPLLPEIAAAVGSLLPAQPKSSEAKQQSIKVKREPPGELFPENGAKRQRIQIG
jgi:hypothetical protein